MARKVRRVERQGCSRAEAQTVARGSGNLEVVKRVGDGGCGEKGYTASLAGGFDEWVERLVSEPMGFGGLVRTRRPVWRGGSHRSTLDQRETQFL